uniref:Secreted protein n=1 Tax=Setaria viridis TaxID=4556 RepID=A0A4U6VUX5_SETVI|nr:hypothetical protein SEVIR_2G256033v2 [Setaria viridis]
MILCIVAGTLYMHAVCSIACATSFCTCENHLYFIPVFLSMKHSAPVRICCALCLPFYQSGF